MEVRDPLRRSAANIWASLAVSVLVVGAAASAHGQSSPWSAKPPLAWSRASSAVADATTGEVVVTKHLPGPALWKVTKGDAQVFILGAATPLPHMLQWDTLRLENALNGADALYLEPRPSLSPMELMRLAVNRAPLELAGGQTLETVLPPREKERFTRMMVTIHGKAQTYDRLKPAIAGLFLIADFRKAAGLSEGKPGTTVMHLAEDAHVPVKSVGDFRLDPFVDTASRLSMADNIACFDAAMDDIDQEAVHGRVMAEAWAKGDLKTVGETYKASLLTSCLMRIPSVQKLLDRGTDQGVQTVQAALIKPGKSVAVVDLNFLLGPRGVLGRLEAAGATVTVPD
ncbi:TraB/GumN family protein [Caulobacter sp. S45]|uniref:TraB/GumN family protein n=1 Tax=Caulobacter sp. S45 TaxID=1641861 RepID=UPI001577419B|nr:TraB/GumN family protein [Caulobacter sp. S45]